MTDLDVQNLIELPGVTTRSGATVDQIKHFVEDEHLQLPEEHQEFLQITDGLSSYGGYFRLLGINTICGYRLGWWNNVECWKFAWNGRCSQFWCFGETAWGDQYAYSLDELKKGRESVFFLDALSMEARIIAPDFDAFVRDEFIRNAKAPYDEMTVKARSVLGELDDSSLLVYSPSPLLGGSEQIENVQKMNARATMIVNGDIVNQVEGVTDELELEEIRTVEDEEGRTRVKLVWKR